MEAQQYIQKSNKEEWREEQKCRSADELDTAEEAWEDRVAFSCWGTCFALTESCRIAVNIPPRMNQCLMAMSIPAAEYQC